MISQRSLGNASETTGRKKDSARKLAELADCHPTYIGQLNVVRKRHLESVEKIASAMDISLSELFDKLGKSGGNNIAAKCYDLVASKNEAEQKQLYKMLQKWTNTKPNKHGATRRRVTPCSA